MARQVIFDKKNILIIGGAGFIGSHLCDELIKKYRVICLDDFSSGDESNIDHLLADPNFKFVRHDITQPINLDELPDLQNFQIKFQGIQEIYYLACPMSPKHFSENKIRIILANSLGVINALELAKKYRAKFLLSSSSVIYGARRDHNQKINEGDLGQVDILSDRSAYDEGKRFAETIVKNYRDVFQLDAKIVRLFRIYGPRMKLGDGHLIPDLIDNALDNQDLQIHGDTNFKSSFCYVGDCIDAIDKIMEGASVGPFNIGSDVDVNLTDVANQIIALTKAKSGIKYTESLLFFTPLCLPDITKARNELGWMPIVPLEKGLEKTIYELRANKGLKRAGEVL
jgi:UDP-glucuronate decarboxylase